MGNFNLSPGWRAAFACRATRGDADSSVPVVHGGLIWGLLLAVIWSASPAVCSAEAPGQDPSIFAMENLVAWCIVPFDGKQRGPAERAAMCAELGFQRVAYDWRAKHVPTFEQEILEYKKHGLEYFAFWGVHDEAFRLFEKYDLHPQIWTMLAVPAETPPPARAQAAATQLLPLVERTRKLGCQLGLYNHGGWGGEPENLVAVCKLLHRQHGADHVGIVYNQHHAHNHTDDFAQVIGLMKPYLLCLNLNGMTHHGDQRGQKILPLGQGELDVKLLQAIQDSGYQGRIGVIGHTQDDVELRLRDNLEGLAWIRAQLEGREAGEKPTPRTWSPPERSTDGSASLPKGIVLPGQAEFRSPPLTVACRATLTDRDRYNILVASDTKQSGAHWEIFTDAGSGLLTAYTPGLIPDHTRSQVMLCDGKPHLVGMILKPERLRLLVDGQVVADQPVRGKGRPAVPGGLAIGRLVEGRLGCSGHIDWVRIAAGDDLPAWRQTTAPPRDEATRLLWVSERPSSGASLPTDDVRQPTDRFGPTPEYSPSRVEAVRDAALRHGDAARGLLVFADAKAACLSCHRVGTHGGTVGPPLTSIGKERKLTEIVESVLWPKRQVKPEHLAHLVVTTAGTTHTGYIIKETPNQIELRDPTRGTDHRLVIPVNEIEVRRERGSLMPEQLTAAMTGQQVHDLVKFLAGLGQPDGLPLADIGHVLHHATAHLHGPAEFPLTKEPLRRADWPHWDAEVNRDRLYDFYAKQADFFRGLAREGQRVPPLLMPFPGLDGGTLGHWGNQSEETWASNAWNDVKLGSLQAGIFRGAGLTVPRAVCLQLGESGELSACFNPDTLGYEAVWRGGFVSFSSVRHGFMHGLSMDGKPVDIADRGRPIQAARSIGRERNNRTVRYEGLYRIGARVAFAYRIGDTRYLDAPWVEDGKFVRHVAPFSQHPLSRQFDALPRQWPDQLVTPVRPGAGRPYAVDTIEMPFDNRWQIPLFGGGLGFLPDGSALLCTMHGDVWRVTGYQHPSTEATWSRFASGLHHCQGLFVDRDGIFVLGRDQITRLHDLNQDGEADFYECFSNAYETSPAGHDFICGLERDAEGHFYLASGNQGIVRISPDGRQADVVATGFRNPDGIGLTSDGVVTVPCSEGSWTPATMICAFRKPASGVKQPVPYFGYPGPRGDEPPELPLVYLPRGIDNSAGGQQVVTSDRWGPLQDQLLHFSFGAGAHFLVLRDEVDGQMQGAVVPLPGAFLSGTHRGRFSPHDGQLYVTGMQGWGSYTPQSGCFQRVRYTGDEVRLPTAFKAYRNGILLRFSAPLEADVAEQPNNHFAQCWNYRYSSAYGSPEFSTRHAGMRGHDHLPITAARLVDDGRGLFLEIPELQPVNQLHLRVALDAQDSRELFMTVHRLEAVDFLDAAGLHPLDGKVVNPHPILTDLKLATRSVPNPFAKRRKGGRKIDIATGSNLSFATRRLEARPGELIELTLRNPDVVPHNWALVKPGTLRRVGQLANRLISDPDAAIRQYIPESDDVLAHTDVVLPQSDFTIYFNAPQQPGRYPYLCTFPGHWLVMNGELVVTEP